MEEKKMGRQLFFAAAIILYGIFLGMPVWGQSCLQRAMALWEAAWKMQETEQEMRWKIWETAQVM